MRALPLVRQQNKYKMLNRSFLLIFFLKKRTQATNAHDFALLQTSHEELQFQNKKNPPSAPSSNGSQAPKGLNFNGAEPQEPWGTKGAVPLGGKYSKEAGLRGLAAR